MIKRDFLAAFTALGVRLRAPTEIVIAGGAALVLLGIIDRETGDSDAIESRPKLSTFATDIAAVAAELDLPPGWLNDGIRAHLNVLPTDYHSRLTDVGTFGALRVRALGRVDLILMKLAAGRPRDLEDLRAFKPTAADLTFVEAQLDRLNRVFPRDALRIQLYLEQNGVMSTRGTDHMGALMADWTRAGAMFTVAPTRTAIDLEFVIARTADLAPQNERLFVMAATWLALRHYLVDARRLVKAVEGLDRHASAVAGALLSVAALATTGTTALHAAIAHCRPLARPQPLFDIMRDYPKLLAVAKRETLPIYREWGFWHTDVELKEDALRPVRWTLQHCPELRLRALLGSGLDAHIAGALSEEQRTVSELPL